MEHSPTSSDGKHGDGFLQSPSSSFAKKPFGASVVIESAIRDQNTVPVIETKNRSSPPSDALEKARIAIAAAEHASAAARAAAELVNINHAPFKLQ